MLYGFEPVTAFKYEVQVLILIFLENALRRYVIINFLHIAINVLILIFLENALRRVFFVSIKQIQAVS